MSRESRPPLEHKRQAVIELLEKALQAAKNTSTHLVEVGLLARQVADTSGVPHNMLDLAHRIRRVGHVLEADLVTLVVDLATAAVTKQDDVYMDSLLRLHDTACQRLDELEEHQGFPIVEGPKIPNERLN